MLIQDIRTINFIISLKPLPVKSGLLESIKEIKEQIDKPLNSLNRLNIRNIWITLNYQKIFKKHINMGKRLKPFNEIKVKAIQ